MNIQKQIEEHFNVAQGNCTTDQGLELLPLYITELENIRTEVLNTFPVSNTSFDIPRNEVIANIDRIIGDIQNCQNSPSSYDSCTGQGQRIMILIILV